MIGRKIVQEVYGTRSPDKTKALYFLVPQLQSYYPIITVCSEQRLHTVSNWRVSPGTTWLFVA